MPRARRRPETTVPTIPTPKELRKQLGDAVAGELNNLIAENAAFEARVIAPGASVSTTKLLKDAAAMLLKDALSGLRAREGGHEGGLKSRTEKQRTDQELKRAYWRSVAAAVSEKDKGLSGRELAKIVAQKVRAQPRFAASSHTIRKHLGPAPPNKIHR